MTFYRLYRIALEHLSEIAEGMLDTKYDANGNIMCWYTLDNKEFENKLDAINHNIDYLLEADNED